MAEVVDLDRFRRKLAADKGFRTWLKRFQDQFGPDTRLADLAPETLLYLATPGEENLYVFFDLVMGAMGLGGALRFRLDDLETPTKLRIMDAAFALMDRVRFEVMRRLGWVEEVPGGDLPLIALVQQAWQQGSGFAREVPRLSPSHPDYEAYRKRGPLDQGTMVRRLIPRAVARFRELVEGQGQSV
jgi:hypothetical protein|uniref:Uncharacterized protein n=1 Tax=Desulfobacca acetoxidans TaxID=60893 RepID=A0A7C3UZ67_9BACT